ncbi:hypothetical protein [Mesomycoplasma lagogenitalium]|uniref:Lipoprotein n=1 Tax=Mesomycoplasma lagogenitalium TaxID=171286 RepID=A0ABY8LUH5_9BACT|nr:hypothetical protein [Mesomycoplasma lagogenitalium]WGI36893.1 hypothetical protein QEG99_01240 [Mesomycoplasma lagogenitalium]
MNIKYKLFLPLMATSATLPIVASCAVNQPPKEETKIEKQIRLDNEEWKRAMELAPNLMKFQYGDYPDYSEYKQAKEIMWHTFKKAPLPAYLEDRKQRLKLNLKELKYLMGNINHLNDFEKAYIGLYQDLQTFFDNQIHRYKPENLTFEYLTTDREIYYDMYLKVKEDTLQPEQMFYHQVLTIIKEFNSWRSQNPLDEFNVSSKTFPRERPYGSKEDVRFAHRIEFLETRLRPIIEQKLQEFTHQHQDFQFKNPQLSYRQINGGDIIVELSFDIEYQNQPISKFLTIPLTVDINLKSSTRGVRLKELRLADQKEQMEKYKSKLYTDKTFAELENLLKKPFNNSQSNYDKLEMVKEEYDATLKVLEYDNLEK